MGCGAGRKWRWKSRWRIRDILADGRRSQVVLDFLSAADVGRLVPAEEDVGSQVSEWERRERREREQERKPEVEELGATGELSAGEALVQGFRRLNAGRCSRK